jgi:hypothetical protein
MSPNDEKQTTSTKTSYICQRTETVRFENHSRRKNCVDTDSEKKGGELQNTIKRCQIGTTPVFAYSLQVLACMMANGNIY